MGTTIDAGLYEVLPRSAEPADDGRLTVGGCALADLAAEFGTPALVFDEQGLRDTVREYLAAFHERHEDTEVHFASKALPCAPVLRILAEEGLGCDVASGGELAIALAAGFDPADVLLHGNAKSDQDIGDALAAGVGLIVIDNADDVDRLERLGAQGQRVLIRVNPAVPGKTHAAVDTGSEEAKFGVPLGQAQGLIERVRGLPGLELLGSTSTSARSCSTSTASAAPRRPSRRSAPSRSTTSAAGWGSPIARTSGPPRWPTTPRRPCARSTTTSIPPRGSSSSRGARSSAAPAWPSTPSSASSAQRGRTSP
jgi:Pyridoxal-dependent decarboxylase, pyridoxal binding domain